MFRCPGARVARMLLVCAAVVGCGDPPPPDPGNQAPSLVTGPSALPARVSAGASVALSVTSQDADGDAQTYTWSQEPASPAGSFSDPAGRAPTWTAPAVTIAQQFTLRVTVADGHGGTTTGVVTVDVDPPPPPANADPVLTEDPGAAPGVVTAGQSVTLSAAAFDADGDTLTFLWEQISPASPQGTFSGANLASPTWIAPSVNESGSFIFRISVTDGRGGRAWGTVSVHVNPAGQANRPPDVAPSIAAPNSLRAGDTAALSIDASDQDGDVLTYAWEQIAPAAQGTWVTEKTAASAQWFSPDVAVETVYSFRVSISDGKAEPVVRTANVTVLIPTYVDVQQIWNDVGCTSCHGSSGGLVLGHGASHSELVNVTANGCSTLKRVEPGNPGDSALVRKMVGTSCGGTRMPGNDTTYFDRHPGLVVRVRSWILAGAAND
ncbi:MAG: PKD domain-containing protein [Myxococcaceae bacterium]|nr:PKD domain-containing protein [Myxococcaceae bacterium]MCI0673764.1 PKD domain-containing protein [Myxococcaceae bacterium]